MTTLDFKTANYSGNGFSGVPVTVSYSNELGPFQEEGVALSRFSTSYGNNTDHHVRNLAAFGEILEVDTNNNTLKVGLTAAMDDDSGNVATDSLSEAAPAVLGAGSSTLVLRNSATKSGTPQTVEFDQSVDSAFLAVAGFQVGYSDNDHHVRNLMVQFDGVNFRRGSASIDFTPDLHIEDASGHSGSGTLYTLAIGQAAGDTNMFKALNWRPNMGEVIVEITDQPTAIDQACVFIQEIELTYGGNDHHVREITIDAGNTNLTTKDEVQPDGTHTWTVTFTPTLSMTDDSGHSQSNSSDIDLLVLATPRTA